MKNTWLLIDSNYLCHRARWSMSNLIHDGKATGVIYGFLYTILQLQKQFSTSNIAFCFDSKHSKREEAYPKYKANRKNRLPMTKEEIQLESDFHKQIKLLRTSYLPQIGFNNIFIQNGYESDDLLAKLAYELGQKNKDVIIVTSDEDLFQCIRKSRICVYNPHKKHIMTSQHFYKQYGIAPHEWCVVKALAGCSTDNIKGLPGIGEKTALRWIREELKKTSKAYKTLDSPESKIIFDTNYPLVKLPYEGTKKMSLTNDNISKQEWHNVCKKLGFKTLINHDFRNRRNRHGKKSKK